MDHSAAACMKRWEKRKIYTVKEFKEMPYKEYLETVYWKEIRFGMMLTRGERCERCKVNFLWGVKYPWPEVHHKTYKNKGCEKLEDLELLCNSCHSVEHAN